MHHFVTEMCIYVWSFLLQNGALWDMGLVHCGVCATGLFGKMRWTNLTPVMTFWWISARLWYFNCCRREIPQSWIKPSIPLFLFQIADTSVTESTKTRATPRRRVDNVKNIFMGPQKDNSRYQNFRSKSIRYMSYRCLNDVDRRVFVVWDTHYLECITKRWCLQKVRTGDTSLIDIDTIR